MKSAKKIRKLGRKGYGSPEHALTNIEIAIMEQALHFDEHELEISVSGEVSAYVTETLLDKGYVLEIERFPAGDYHQLTISWEE